MMHNKAQCAFMVKKIFVDLIIKDLLKTIAERI